MCLGCIFMYMYACMYVHLYVCIIWLPEEIKWARIGNFLAYSKGPNFFYKGPEREYYCLVSHGFLTTTKLCCHIMKVIM